MSADIGGAFPHLSVYMRVSVKVKGESKSGLRGYDLSIGKERPAKLHELIYAIAEDLTNTWAGAGGIPDGDAEQEIRLAAEAIGGMRACCKHSRRCRGEQVRG